MGFGEVMGWLSNAMERTAGEMEGVVQATERSDEVTDRIPSDGKN